VPLLRRPAAGRKGLAPERIERRIDAARVERVGQRSGLREEMPQNPDRVGDVPPGTFLPFLGLIE